MSAPAVEVSGLVVDYDEVRALDGVDARFEAGRLSAIVGPNGAGKSTLVKALVGALRPTAGEIRSFGSALDPRRGALSYVPQRSAVDWDFPVTVRDVVSQGRFPHCGWFRRLRPQDNAAIDAALERTGLTALADRPIGALSGGQQQRAFLARALAHDGAIVLLDEPFAGVDAATEQALLGTLQELRARGRAIIVVHHDLATVRAWFDDVLLLNRRTVAQGPVGEVFDPARIQATYGGRLARFDDGSSMVAP
jgi:manganese/zinc/iron transport system ATP- binding protein